MASTYRSSSFKGQLSNIQKAGESASVMYSIADADQTAVGTIAGNLQTYTKAALAGIRANPAHISKAPADAAALAIAIATAYQARVGNPADPSGDAYEQCLAAVCSNQANVANSPSRIAEIAAVYAVDYLT